MSVTEGASNPEGWRRLGETVRSERQRQCLSRLKLAELAGVSPKSIQTAEEGRTPAARWPYTIDAIEKALGWPAGEARAILDGRSEAEKPPHQPSAPDVADGPNNMTDVARRRIRQLRGARGWTAAELGQRLQALGVPWDRSIVANFETGRRQALSVAELVGLALVFDVAPVNIIVPLDERAVAIAPGRVDQAGAVREWVRGTAALPGVDERSYFAEASLTDLRRPDQCGCHTAADHILAARTVKKG